MKQSPHSSAVDFIVPLNMNGLQGRMLSAPPTKQKKREIMLVYGHHAKLERWWGPGREPARIRHRHHA
jgi:hypothetical protein